MNENQNQKVEMPFEWELSTNCHCEYYDEQYDEYKPANECYGCYDDDLTDIKNELLNKWLDANDYELDTPIKLVGSQMTWRGVGGYKVTTPENLVASLELMNADFTLYFRASSDHKILEIVRTSHDELGALFEIVPATQDELDDYNNSF